MERREFVLRIEGEGLGPATMSAKDLGDILREFQLTIESHAKEIKQDIDKAVPISLLEIGDGSTVLALGLDAGAWVAYLDVANLVNSGRFQELAKDVKAHLARFEDWSRKRHWTFRFLNPAAEAGVEMVIDPVNGIAAAAAPVLIRGGATLVGECIRLGGKEPKVDIRRVPQGNTIHASATKEIVQQLADRLYQVISVEGEATWDASTWEIRAFTVKSVNPYRPGRVDEGIKELARISGDAWKDVDALEYVRSLRED